MALAARAERHHLTIHQVVPDLLRLHIVLLPVRLLQDLEVRKAVQVVLVAVPAVQAVQVVVRAVDLAVLIVEEDNCHLI